jgi:hypothetical protein
MHSKAMVQFSSSLRHFISSSFSAPVAQASPTLVTRAWIISMGDKENHEPLVSSMFCPAVVATVKTMSMRVGGSSA